MSALQEQFVTEARELIRQATDNLIALERDGTRLSGSIASFVRFIRLRVPLA